jgi:type I restriction enzyme R subunit
MGFPRRRTAREARFSEHGAIELLNAVVITMRYDSLRYFVFTTIQEAGVGDAESVSAKIANAFVDHPNWRQSEAALREVRKVVTFAVYAAKDDLDEVSAIVEKLLDKLLRSTV